MVVDIMKLISKDISLTVKVEKLFSKKVRKGLGIIFGFFAAFLFLSNALILASTFNLSVSLLYFVSTLLAFISIIPGVDISDATPVQIDLIPGTNFHINLAHGFHFWNGVLIISLFAYILIKLLNAYIRSHHYRNQALYERGKLTGKSYYVKEVFANEHFGDLIYSFFTSRAGKEISKRLNLSKKKVKDFLSNRSCVVDYRTDRSLIDIASLEDLSSFVLQNKEVLNFITKNNISTKQFIDAAVFVEYYFSLKDNNDRFFGRKYLSYIIPFENIFSFNHSNYLKKYLRQVDLPNYFRNNNDVKLNLSKLEELMCREDKTNVLLVGNNEYSTYNLLVQFYKQITYNYRNKNLKGKYLYLLDVEDFCLKNKTTHELEKSLNGLFSEIVACGNIILIIPSFHTLLIHSKNCEVDLSLILNSNGNKHLKIIATTNTNYYYDKENGDLFLNEHFTPLNISDSNKNYLYDLVSESICQKESEEKIIFTVSALNQIISFAEKYYVCGLFVDKIKELIEEVGQYAKNNNLDVIDGVHVDKFIEYFPDAVVRKEVGGEKINIANLANNLKREVSGQDYAISTIVSLIRDKNDSLDENKKPVSFIIFGPDNHLKMELISSLSRSIIGNEDNIIILDMTEYVDEKAVNRLMGNNNLANKIKNHGTKIIVFADFEKAHSDVHDLFRHISSTGTVTMQNGETISLSGTIIIALSNIGSTEVYINLHNNGLHDRDFESKILTNIKNKNIIKSDVLDSFDDKILFKAANDEDIRKVTINLLNILAKRLNNEGVTLIVNDYLVDSVMRYGIDPSFGIAPIKKAIHDIVEKRIREKMINGMIMKGNVIEFKEGEIV